MGNGGDCGGIKGVVGWYTSISHSSGKFANPKSRMSLSLQQ